MNAGMAPGSASAWRSNEKHLAFWHDRTAAWCALARQHRSVREQLSSRRYGKQYVCGNGTSLRLRTRNRVIWDGATSSRSGAELLFDNFSCVCAYGVEHLLSLDSRTNGVAGRARSPIACRYIGVGGPWLPSMITHHATRRFSPAQTTRMLPYVSSAPSIDERSRRAAANGDMATGTWVLFFSAAARRTAARIACEIWRRTEGASVRNSHLISDVTISSCLLRRENNAAELWLRVNVSALSSPSADVRRLSLAISDMCGS